MVVVKTLTYRQFSFLLSMASARTGSVGSSSDVGSTGSQTPLSSEMSEVRRRGASIALVGGDASSFYILTEIFTFRTSNIVFGKC